MLKYQQVAYSVIRLHGRHKKNFSSLLLVMPKKKVTFITKIKKSRALGACQIRIYS